MGDINALVLKGFGLRAKKIVKDKSDYICDTPDGYRVIHKAQENSERILFQHAVKEYVAQAGYPWVDRYCVTPEGKPYLPLGEALYVVMPYQTYREPDFTNWKDYTRVVEALAEWHRCARGVAFDGEVPVFSQSIPLTEVYKKQAGELAAIRKRVNRQARLSDFDVLFIKNAGYYAGQIKAALDGLTQTPYAPLHAKALAERHICHHALKEESLPFSGEHVYVTQYADACADMQLNDLGALIRRYLQRTGENAAPIQSILEVYDRIEPLPRGGVDILRALLLYPYQFLKILNQYYSKKRTWTPNAMTNRMQSAVAGKDVYERYLNGLG